MAGFLLIAKNNFYMSPLQLGESLPLLPRSTQCTDSGNLQAISCPAPILTALLIVFPLDLIDRAFSKFRHKDVVHLSRLKDGLNVLELWHGVTYAFKDLSLSCTGQFLQYFLEKKQKHINVLVGEYFSLEGEGFYVESHHPTAHHIGAPE